MKKKNLLILAIYIICVALVLAATYIGSSKGTVRFTSWFLIVLGGVGTYNLIRKNNGDSKNNG